MTTLRFLGGSAIMHASGTASGRRPRRRSARGSRWRAAARDRCTRTAASPPLHAWPSPATLDVAHDQPARRRAIRAWRRAAACERLARLAIRRRQPVGTGLRWPRRARDGRSAEGTGARAPPRSRGATTSSRSPCTTHSGSRGGGRVLRREPRVRSPRRRYRGRASSRSSRRPAPRPRRTPGPNARRRRAPPVTWRTPSAAASAPPADMPATTTRRASARYAWRTASICASRIADSPVPAGRARVEPVPAAPGVRRFLLPRQQHDPALRVGEIGDARGGGELLGRLPAAVTQHEHRCARASACVRSERRRGSRAAAAPAARVASQPFHEPLAPDSKRPGSRLRRKSRAKSARRRLKSPIIGGRGSPPA